MNVTQLLSILLARKWVVMGFMFFAITTTVVLSLLWPKQYLGTATILIEAKPDPLAGTIYPVGRPMATQVATQVDIIKSIRVAQRVVRNLKLTESPAIRAQWLESTAGEIPIEAWLVSNLTKTLEVLPALESNVVTINYTSTDPRYAAEVANAFVQAYLQVSLELRVDPARQFTGFFEQRTKEARETLEKAQTKVSAFQRENGLIASDERLDVETARLNELSTQLVMLQSASAEAGGRQAQARGPSADKMEEVLSNGLINSLKAELSRAEANFKQLNSRLGDNHPQVIEATANIKELRSRIDIETRRVTGGVSVAASINRQREGDIRTALEAQRSKVLRLKQVREDGAVLLRDVESAQRSYDALLARLNQSSMESQTDQSGAYVLTPASPPTQPSSPILVLNLALAIVVGGIFSLGLALLLEMIDRRVRTPVDLVDNLGLPMLGAMPKPTAKRFIGRATTPLMQQRLLAQLPAASKGA